MIQVLVIFAIMAGAFAFTLSQVDKNKEKFLSINPYLQSIYYIGIMMVIICVGALLQVPIEFMFPLCGILFFFGTVYLASLFKVYYKRLTAKYDR